MFSVSKQLAEEMAQVKSGNINHYSEWKKRFAIFPRKIHGETFWLTTVYKRKCYLDNTNEYGTLADVLSCPRDRLLEESLHRHMVKQFEARKNAAMKITMAARSKAEVFFGSGDHKDYR